MIEKYSMEITAVYVKFHVSKHDRLLLAVIVNLMHFLFIAEVMIKTIKTQGEMT